MSWELISSIMVITLPADYLAAMALPQGFPWVLQQLIFSVAGAPELEQHGRQLPCNRLEEGRETEGRREGEKKPCERSAAFTFLPSPIALPVCPARLSAPCAAWGCPHGWWAGWDIWVTFPRGMFPPGPRTWHISEQPPAPRAYSSAPCCRGGDAGSDLSKNK